MLLKPVELINPAKLYAEKDTRVYSRSTVRASPGLKINADRLGQSDDQVIASSQLRLPIS